jgi:hypothetical protein
LRGGGVGVPLLCYDVAALGVEGLFPVVVGADGRARGAPLALLEFASHGWGWMCLGGGRIGGKVVAIALVGGRYRDSFPWWFGNFWGRVGDKRDFSVGLDLLIGLDHRPGSIGSHAALSANTPNIMKARRAHVERTFWAGFSSQNRSHEK